MASKNPSFPHLAIVFVLSLLTIVAVSSPDFDDTRLEISDSYGGNWVLLHSSIGVSAMHMQLLRNSKVVIFDGLEVGPSNLTLPNNQCLTVTRPAATATPPRTANSSSAAAKISIDCTAHSVLYDAVSNAFRPLILRTNTWCSSGSVFPDGTLLQTGGYGDGIRKIRTFFPDNCDDYEDDHISTSASTACDWTELVAPSLAARRWYASNQILPDGRVIIFGGRQSFSYEFFPKIGNRNDELFYVRFLAETVDPYEENNLYPFLHLLPDGNLFVFANNRSITFDYSRNLVVKEFPVIPGGFKRSYPSTGSSVLLSLKLTSDGSLPDAEVMICGGSPPGAFTMSNRARVFLPAARSCGRIRVSDAKPRWAMEDMPMPRVMPDMIVLPTGDVIIINGASRGTAGWNNAIRPVLSPVLYRTGKSQGRRFLVLNPTTVPRMYHSSALLLPSGGILVGGSNPHRRYNFTGKPYPTELSLEVYQPYYLGPQYAEIRPSILTVEASAQVVSYGQLFSVTFVLPVYRASQGGGEVSVALVTPSFSTHSYAMNQRVLLLDVAGLVRLSDVTYKVTARGPPTSSVGPPGYYMLFVVHAGVPGEGVWVRVM